MKNKHISKDFDPFQNANTIFTFYFTAKFFY